MAKERSLMENAVNKIDTEELFKLPQEEKLKILVKELPLKVKIPFFAIGVLGILTNCLTSALGGTVIHDLILNNGYTEFWAKFLSLALSLFSLHMLNSLMNTSGHWVISKLVNRE